MAFGRRGGGNHRTTRGGSQDMSRRKQQVVAVQGSGDIFALETPKAYSPLGYSIPETPRVLRPEDFNNDLPLPSCPARPPQYISQPLQATFLDTESEKPNFQGANRVAPPRDNTSESADGRSDPTNRLIKANMAKKLPLILGKNVISEASLETGTLYPPEKILKRERETTNEPEDHKEVKKQKKELRIKFDGEEEGDINEDTVKPENVLRMVDSSLVDTPEKKNQDEYLVNNNANGSMAATPVRPNDYYSQYREREPRLRDRGDYSRDGYPYRYPRDNYKIPPSSAPSPRPPSSPYRHHRHPVPGPPPPPPPMGSLPPRGSAGYYDDYGYRYAGHHARPTSVGSAQEFYDDRYYDDRYSRYGPPPPPPPPLPPHGHGPPLSPHRRPPSLGPPGPLPARRRDDYDFDEYDLAPPPLPPQPPSPDRDYRGYSRHMRSGSAPRRYDRY